MHPFCMTSNCCNGVNQDAQSYACRGGGGRSILVFPFFSGINRLLSPYHQHNIILNSSSSPLFSSIESLPTCMILFTTLLFPFFSGNHPVLTTCIYIRWTTTIIVNPKPIITTTTTTATKRVFLLF